jgi:cyclohexanone monooxygenase
VRIIEKGGDFGGTWYWNRYPGAMCDVESYIYLPLLEELDYVPSEKYARAPEILAHSRAIGRQYDLYRNACFQTEVTEMRWDEAGARWTVSTNRGDRMRAHHVVMSNGPLNRPKLPGIPGIGSFEGHSFHTSRWDYAYTGGDSNGNLTGLRGKRVGIIGTGATAVQCVPHLGAAAEQLYVFQRTPSSIDVRGNRPTDPEWAKSLAAGWHRQRMDNFNILVTGGYQAEDLVSDGWTDIIRKLLVMVQKDEGGAVSRDGIAKTLETADFQKMEQIRARVDSVVRDPETAEALKPYYRQFCKRPCFHDEYLDTFNRPNVTLVDTKGRGVERITPKGVVARGVEYECDCLIFATGFEVGTDYSRRAGYEIYGRNGASLTEKWKDGVTTLHGMFTRGFPNCFIMGPQQAGFTVNYPHMLDEQSKHITHIVQHAVANDVRTVEVSEAAEREWVDTVVRMAVLAQEFLENCTPGYYNNEGKPGERAGQDGFYGGGSVEFFRILQEWRDAGDMKGLELRRPGD